MSKVTEPQLNSCANYLFTLCVSKAKQTRKNVTFEKIFSGFIFTFNYKNVILFLVLKYLYDKHRNDYFFTE